MSSKRGEGCRRAVFEPGRSEAPGGARMRAPIQKGTGKPAATFYFSRSGAHELEQPVAAAFLIFSPLVVALAFFAAALPQATLSRLNRLSTQRLLGVRLFRRRSSSPLTSTAGDDEYFQGGAKALMSPEGLSTS